MKNLLQDKNLLITGGSGSFGRAFLARIKEFKPRLIKIYSRNEYLLWQIKEKYDSQVELVIGDVRDAERLDSASRGIDILIHAAALKHIDFCEENPEEAFKTNVLGTKNVISAALKNKIKKAVYLSADKAVNPTSVYGLTKLLGEKIFQEANKPARTTFFSLRYSNVISSHGGVLEKFINKVREGGNLEVYSPKMERFFLTQNQVVDLLEFVLPLAKGGETFLIVPPKVKIIELAQQIAKLNSKTKIKVAHQPREGEKESAILVAPDEHQRLYKLEKNWFVILPAKIKAKKGKPVSIKEWEKATSRYIGLRELKDLIAQGKKELCL